MIFAVYIILLSLCVSYLLISASKSSGIVKLIAITLLVHGYVTSAVTLKQTAGYPTTSELPEKFQILYGRVVEDTGTPFIELWISYDMSKSNKIFAWFSMAGSMNDLTRVYRMPYSEENHEMLLKIQRKIMAGQRVGVIQSDNEGNEIDLRNGMQNYNIQHRGYTIQKSR